MDYLKDIERFRKKLNDDTQWPAKYMFKFIVPNKDGKVEQVKALLTSVGELSYKHTSSLKYVSVTCLALMQNADEVINVTLHVNSIEGVLAL